MAESGMAGTDRPVGIVITGPTAVGKTELSLGLARELEGEIISMDSRQVYIGMDIGTAKATASERAAVRHHGLDLIRPDERYSAGQFARDARHWIEEIRGRGRIPILVGGTGFFLEALTRPLFEEPELDPERRERLDQYLRGLPVEILHSWLRELDPETARRLEGWGGRQRLQRAIEIAILTGRPLPWWHEHSPPSESPLPLLTFILDRPRAELYERIDQRVDEMIEEGLVEEVERLLQEGYQPDDPGLSGTGYPEIIAFLKGEYELEEAADAIRRATRRYARRQLTWFRNRVPDAIWIDARERTERLIEIVTKRWIEAVA